MESENNEHREPPPPESESDSTGGTRLVLTMGGIGVIAGTLLVVTYLWTQPAIERNIAEALERSIFDVLPEARQSVTFAVVDGRLQPLGDGEDAPVKYYAGYDDGGQLAGVAVEAAGQGFQDTLSVLYGYSPDCECILGFKVMESKETPGLGDKIETDPDFTANFDALDVSLGPDMEEVLNPIVMVKHGQKTEPWQIDAITGATISSQAVANILRDSSVVNVPLFIRNRQVLNDGNSSDDLTGTN
jgi:electron transport complex protein RnfG